MVPRKITIEPVLNGYLCRVGCQQLVFEGRTSLLGALAVYLENPAQVEQQFAKTAIHADLLRECPPTGQIDPASGEVCRPPQTMAEQQLTGCDRPRTASEIRRTPLPTFAENLNPPAPLPPPQTDSDF